jgi:hypothetical protein
MRWLQAHFRLKAKTMANPRRAKILFPNNPTQGQLVMRVLQPAKTAKTIGQSQKRHEIQTVGMLPLVDEGPETYTVDGAARILKLTPGRVGQMLRAGDLELSLGRALSRRA